MKKPVELQYIYRDLYNAEEQDAASYNIIQDKVLKIKEYENAVIVPLRQGKCKNGVYDSEGRYIIDSGWAPFSGMTVRDEKFEHEDTDYCISDNEVEYWSEETVIYGGLIFGHYGHFLMDTTRRLWLDWKNCDEKIVFIADSELPEFVKEFFDLLGIQISDDMVIKKNTRFKKVLIPDFSYYHSDFITYDYKKIFDTVMQNVCLDLPVYDKIYFSRVHFAGKGISRKGGAIVHHEYGENIVEKIFSMNGYKILYPEELTLKEQVHYVNNCDMMVTTNGTIAHNIIFAKENTKLVILNKFTLPYFGNWHQLALNKLREIDFTSIDVFARGSYRGFSLMILSKPLRKYFKDNAFKIKLSVKDYLLLLSYYGIFYSRLLSRTLKDMVKHK